MGSPPSELLLAAGAWPEVTSDRKFGDNPAVGTTYEIIESGGGVYPWPTSAQPVRIRAGGNAADTAGGAGARSILVTGLDENTPHANQTVEC